MRWEEQGLAFWYWDFLGGLTALEGVGGFIFFYFFFIFTGMELDGGSLRIGSRDLGFGVWGSYKIGCYY